MLLEPLPPSKNAASAKARPPVPKELVDELEDEPAATTPDAVRRLLRRVFDVLAPRDAVLTSGLGMEGCALLDMVAPLELPVRVVFLDTGFHFEETLELLSRLEERYPGLDFETLHPASTPAEQAAREGDALWRRDPDRCCALRKIEPLEGRLRGADLWISAITRSQSAARASQPVLAAESRFGVPKLSPLTAWERPLVWRHVEDHGVPFNPLHLRSYPTISCHHCTLPVPGLGPHEYSRDGRWTASSKTECGLHADSSTADSNAPDSNTPDSKSTADSTPEAPRAEATPAPDPTAPQGSR